MEKGKHISLSELQAAVKGSLEDSFPAPVWITAEIADLKVNYSSGHCYLELVEKGSANGVPKAQARAVIWRQTYGMLSSYFEGATDRKLEVGMKVLVSVSITYHELYGLSLRITDIDPLYTIGDMERQRQAAIAQLTEDGVFDLNRELGFPPVPQRIAVISSPGAAGFRDFMKELENCGYRFTAVLFEAVMQGHGAEESIIGALERIASRTDDFDAVAIIRGGGSQSDLNFLNSYLLSFHIAQFPLPVIAGLGHDKDRSVVDMVAAVSLKTPTAAAGFLIRKAAELDASLDELSGRVALSAGRLLAGNDKTLAGYAETLARHSRDMTHRLELRLARIGTELAGYAGRFVQEQYGRLDILGTLLAEKAANKLANCSDYLDNTGKIIAARDPKAILSLGFSIVRAGGKVVRRAGETTPGENIEITLYEGDIKAKVTDNGKRE